jgi:aspartyl-tRNA(Asn)/glutamyl-tRNA(Gln) amidotransferase subunit A
MSALPPLAPQGLAALAADLREGRLTAEALCRDALDRIGAMEPKLEAFTHVDPERALGHARSLDALRRSGVGLGPLMGIPVAIKDLFTVEGMPSTGGSRLDIRDLVPPQGPFVNALLTGGCVPIGKTRTTEFALGGFNLGRPPPWNPCDMAERRMTGGSSHGSAVAMAAGLAGFTVGSDTGGSVRWPAALCGVVGYKATSSHWPLEGVLPLSPEMDSIGIFTHSAADAAFVEAALAGRRPGGAPPVGTLRFALPTEHFLDALEAPVAACFEAAVAALRKAGATLVELPVPEARWIDDVFRQLVPADLIAFLGRERVARDRALLDPVAAARLDGGADLRADDYVRMRTLRRKAEQAMAERSRDIDAWITPTVPLLPHPIAGYRTVEQVAAWNGLATRNTRPGNLFGQCGISLPIQHLGAALPVGLQLTATGGRDARLLEIAQAVETLLGR